MFAVTAAALAALDSAKAAMAAAFAIGNSEMIIATHAAAHDAHIVYTMILAAEEAAYNERISEMEKWIEEA